MTENVLDPTYYDVLGVEPNAPAEKIKAIYRLRTKTVHPDRNQGNEEPQKRLNQAYETLSDPQKREAYNRKLGLPKPRRSKPGQSIYEEIEVDSHSDTNQVPFSFSRWEPCSRCWGEGCRHCHHKGKTLETVSLTVTIPARISQVAIRRQGTRVEPGGSRGDLILYVIWRD